MNVFKTKYASGLKSLMLSHQLISLGMTIDKKYINDVKNYKEVLTIGDECPEVDFELLSIVIDGEYACNGEEITLFYIIHNKKRVYYPLIKTVDTGWYYLLEYDNTIPYKVIQLTKHKKDNDGEFILVIINHELYITNNSTNNGAL